MTPAELRRYGRHTLLPEVGIDGQRRLKAARVLLVGAGGLGSPAAIYLAAAGVGTLGLVEFDTVDESNLQRQILYTEADIGRPKLEVAVARLRALNPHVEVVPHPTRLTAANVLEIVRDYDVVADGTDNFPARYLINDACVLTGTPNVYAAVLRFAGQLSVFWPPHGPCYRCLWPEPPPPGRVPSCAEAGVLGVLPGQLGAAQATEVVKLVLGLGQPLVGRLLSYDALRARWAEVKVARDPRCPLCGEQPTITAPTDLVLTCPSQADLSVTELAARFARGERPVVIDVREPHERAAMKIPHTLHIPLGVLLERAGELDREAELILQCHSGARSRKALELLAAQGFTRLRNLDGGILAWQREIGWQEPADGV